MITRKGNKDDLVHVLGLIKELAEYENAPLEVTNSVEKMTEDFDVFELVVAEENDEIIGIAIFFPYYSTWKGKCIYLEDIVVTEKMRGKGVGKLLFDEVVSFAKNYKAKRLMWQVLDWNKPAINFYKKLNADLDDEWINCKLTEEQIVNY